MGQLFSLFSSSKSNQIDIDLVIKKMYVERHGASCANSFEKVFGKGQREKTKYAPDSGISYIGVQQCLQVSDYFTKHPINDGTSRPNGTSGTNRTNGTSGTSGTNGTKPILIFCCSELIRTQQTLCLSWIKYMKEYKEKGGKIIVLPWLNEVAVMKIFGKIANSNNYPVSLENTRTKWNQFIDNLRAISRQNGKLKNDVCNPLCNLEEYIPDITDWDSLFYLSDIIYSSNSSNRSNNRSKNKFTNKGKKIEIKRVRGHGFKGLFKRIGDQDQLLEKLDEILRDYITKQGIHMDTVQQNGIELVIVAHHNSAEGFMNKLIPETIETFKHQQLVNCEVVSLPEYNLTQQTFVGAQSPITGFERIFPMKFQKREFKITIDKEQVYPLFVLYIEALNLFLSINNIVATKLLSLGNGANSIGANSNRANYKRNNNKGTKIKKPIEKFLKMTKQEYIAQLNIFLKYLNQINTNYYGSNTGSNTGSTNFFYDYKEMRKKIEKASEDAVKTPPLDSNTLSGYITTKTDGNKNKTRQIFRENFLELCGLTQEQMTEIGVFS